MALSFSVMSVDDDSVRFLSFAHSDAEAMLQPDRRRWFFMEANGAFATVTYPFFSLSSATCVLSGCTLSARDLSMHRLCAGMDVFVPRSGPCCGCPFAERVPPYSPIFAIRVDLTEHLGFCGVLFFA